MRAQTQALVFSFLVLPLMASAMAHASDKGCDAVYGTPTSVVGYDFDALGLASGQTENGTFEPSLLAKISRELTLLRAQIQGMDKVHDQLSYPGRFFSLEIYLSDDLGAKVIAELESANDFSDNDQWCSRNLPIKTLTSLEPIVRALSQDPNAGEAVAHVFGGQGVNPNISPMAQRVLEISVSFSEPRDLSKLPLVSALRTIPGVKFAGESGLIGDGNRIYRIAKEPASVDYVVVIGSGDCPAGCISHSYNYFSIVDSTVVQTRSDSPFSLWGIPYRPALKAFASYDDLVTHLQSSKWWERLYAVRAIRDQIRSQGADLHYGEDLNADVVAKTKPIAEAIIQNRVDLEQKLATMATADSDPDVRAAAIVPKAN